MRPLAESTSHYVVWPTTLGRSVQFRVGEYRILYRIDDNIRRIEVYRIRHRQEAYR